MSKRTRGRQGEYFKRIKLQAQDVKKSVISFVDQSIAYYQGKYQETVYRKHLILKDPVLVKCLEILSRYGLEYADIFETPTYERSWKSYKNRDWYAIKESIVDICKKNEQKQTLTQAILISFIAKGDDVKEFTDELMKECEETEYFKNKMYENKIEFVRDNKAKFQFVMFHSGKHAMEDPNLKWAVDRLDRQERVRGLKVSTIPYFIE